MSAEPEELPTFPHVYTEGDRFPDLLFVISDFDLTGYLVDFLVERPNGTGFERAGILLSPNQVKGTLLSTDWIAGCSQLTVRFTAPGGEPQHAGPILVNTKPKPTITP